MTVYCYKLETLELVLKKEPCIEFTQESLIESSFTRLSTLYI